jgi:D-sedoheptulose 7-phosphate isomerase
MSMKSIVAVDELLSRYFSEAAQISQRLDLNKIELMVELLRQARENSGRLFILGVGGSAANASHAVNDFRKICGIEAYAPSDNVAELTARVNDEGWESSYAEWLRGSRIRNTDLVLVLSVGGGSTEKGISMNIVHAVDLAKTVGAKVIGIVGRDGGHTAAVGDAVVVVPTLSPDLVTPHTEAFQAVIWHAIVSHPGLKTSATKWESI